jgi:glutamine amidotransferase
MMNLQNAGWLNALNDIVNNHSVPVLGICLGMQLMCKKSEEGQLPGLGWLDAETFRFKFHDTTANLKIPHMGWNQIITCQSHPLFIDLENVNRFYFVHSYHVVCSNPDNILASTFYGYDFTSAIVKDNIMGVQFHPEKSHKFGMQLLKNFWELV